MNWQPIETAPKDGTRILIFNGNTLSAYWYKFVSKQGGSWQLTEAGGYAGDGDLSSEPTHWMPLPEAPTV